MSRKKPDDDAIPHDGIQAVADLFQVMDAQDQDRILKELSEKDPVTFEKIKQKLIQFVDLSQLEPEEFSKLFPKMPQAKWALALRGLDLEQSDLFFQKLSKRAAQELQETVNDLGPQRITDVKQARAEILEKAKWLDDQGEISLRKNKNEWVK